MAVRADDIALGHLGQDPLEPEVADHGHDRFHLGRGTAVIELHCAGREPATAVGAWHRPNLIEDVGVVAPPCTVIRGPWGVRQLQLSTAHAMLGLGSPVMTVGAHDVHFSISATSAARFLSAACPELTRKDFCFGSR